MRKNPALTAERMRKLEEMGMDTSDASMVYVKCPVSGELQGPQANTGQFENGDCYAYTLEDVLRKLSTMKDHTFWLTEYAIMILDRNAEEEKIINIDTTEWHAFKTLAYKALAYCFEKGYITNENKATGWLERGMP